MIVLFWCPSCKVIHGMDLVAFPTPPDVTVYCKISKNPVEPRMIHDDPDDPNYGLPRCRICMKILDSPDGFCTVCG